MRKNNGLDEDQTEAQFGDDLPVPSYRSRTPKPFPAESSEDVGSGAAGAESRFLRRPGRVPPRRRLAQRGKWYLWLRIAAGVFALAGVVALGWETRSFLRHDARFWLNNTADIELQGNQVVTRPEVARVFVQDVGRSVFAVPLAARRAAIEEIPWVRRATVMRLWPNRMRVAIVERAPVAYLRDGNAIRLVDADGVLLAMPPGGLPRASFPVVAGVADNGSAAARAANMQPYLQFMAALDAGGEPISQSVSEVNISDPEDIRAMIDDGASQILVHFGDRDFLARYQAFVAHRAEWLRLYPRLASVDMRYGRQVVLDMAPGSGSEQHVTTTTETSNTANSTAHRAQAGKDGR